MTLIEILIAVSVSTLIMGVALSVYLTLSASLLRQTNTRIDDVAVALDSLRHDLACCVQVSFSNTPAFEVQTVPDGDGSSAPSTLALCAANLPSGEAEFARMEVKHIRYALRPDGDKQLLQRESVTLWGAEAFASPVSNALLKGVSRFELSVLDNAGWTNRWSSRPNRPLPRAARIRLDWESARTTETASIVVFIPAGNSLSARKPPAP
jgi:hypothetical protein